MSAYLIYGLRDPRTLMIRYVGKSSSGLSRPNVHRQLHRKNGLKTHLANWVRELEHAGHTYEVLVLEHLATATDFREAEPRWIRSLREAGHDLTNATNGGEGIVGYHHTAETRARMSAVRKGRIPSFEHREALSKALSGRKLSDEHCAKISLLKIGNKNNLGRVWSAEERLKVSQALTGRKLSEDSKQKQRATHVKFAKPFVDQHGVTYCSTKDAVRRLGVDVSSVVRVLKGRLKSTKGYIFTYVHGAKTEC